MQTNIQTSSLNLIHWSVNGECGYGLGGRGCIYAVSYWLGATESYDMEAHELRIFPKNINKK